MVAADEGRHSVVGAKRHDARFRRCRQIAPVDPVGGAQITKFGRETALVSELHGIMLRVAETETGCKRHLQRFDRSLDDVTADPDLPGGWPIAREGFLAVMHQGFIFEALGCQLACQHTMLGYAVEGAGIADEPALVGKRASDVL